MGKTGIAYHQAIKVVRKYRSGEYMSGYPKVYNICDAFGEYGAITLAELKVLSEYDYLQRSGDFEKYVRGLENTENPRLLNQPVNYMPDYCPIGDDLAVTMSVITDTDSVVTDKVTAFFSIYGKQFSQTQVTASGNTIICTTNDASGDFAFAGWADAGDPDTVISFDRTYEFIITQNTALIAKWTRESAIQLVLTAGDNVDSVTGAGKYAYNALATVDAGLKNGASFSGWYRNGILVSTSQHYSFNILEYTELEARASMGDEAYELIVNKNSVVIIGQGGSTWVDYISRKNGVSTPVTFSKDSDWIRLTIDTFAHNFTISVDKNDTGVARNGTVTITQDESGKKAYVYVQQQATAPDNEYEWVLNDSEILAEIELFKKSISGEENYWVFDYLKDWTPSNPYLIVPTEPCTYEDYISGRKLMYNTYTVTIYYHSSVRSSAIRYPTVDVNIWFDAKIKS